MTQKTTTPGLSVQSRFVPAGQEPVNALTWDERSSMIRNPDGSVVFEMNNIRIPQGWTQVATDILAQKYFRKAGIPAKTKKVTEAGIPEWLQRSVPDQEALDSLPENERFGPEKDALQVFHRMAGCWTYWGFKHNYFKSENDARAYYNDMLYMLANQMAAPNSPQWFNTGLHWAYGIEGPAQGHYYVDLRHWFQPEPKQEFVATKRGVSLPAECLAELLGGLDKLHQAIVKANEGVSREKKASSSFQTRRSPQAWASR